MTPRGTPLSLTRFRPAVVSFGPLRQWRTRLTLANPRPGRITHRFPFRPLYCTILTLLRFRGRHKGECPHLVERCLRFTRTRWDLSPSMYCTSGSTTVGVVDTLHLELGPKDPVWSRFPAFNSPMTTHMNLPVDPEDDGWHSDDSRASTL